jgi:hypothetical protein
MEIPDVHPINIALRYNPPMLIYHYYLGTQKELEFAHQVNLLLQQTATSSQIVDELLVAEPVYFNPNIIPREQVIIFYIKINVLLFL